MSTEPNTPMTIAEAINAVGQLARLFRGAARTQALLEHLAGLEQQISERDSLARAAAERLAAVRGELDQLNATAEHARQAARAAEEARSAALADARSAAARVRAAVDREVAGLTGEIARKREELGAINAALADVRARLGS